MDIEIKSERLVKFCKITLRNRNLIYYMKYPSRYRICWNIANKTFYYQPILAYVLSRWNPCQRLRYLYKPTIKPVLSKFFGTFTFPSVFLELFFHSTIKNSFYVGTFFNLLKFIHLTYFTIKWKFGPITSKARVFFYTFDRDVFFLISFLISKYD